MIKLKSFIINESLKLSFGEEFSTEQKRLATEALKYYIKKEWPYIENASGKMANRFEFELTRIRDAWSEIIITFKYSEKGGKSVNMPPYPESPRIVKHKVHNDIKSAIDDIPKNQNSVYRGMSFEEALAIKKKGYIMSNSSLTLGASQEGYTFFGEDPKTAHFYASGFQPLPLTGTRNKPPVIIEIPKTYVTPADTTINTKTNHPVGSRGEWVSNKPIETNKISNVWFVISKSSTQGDFDVIYDKHQEKFHGGSRAPISIRSVLVNKPDFFT